MANSFEPQLPNRNTVDIPADKSVDFKKQIAEESTNNINAADSFWENEIFDKYNNPDIKIRELSCISFNYSILLFNYIPSVKLFEFNSLCWDEARNLLHDAGFAKRKLGNVYIYIQQVGCIIKEVTPEIMRNFVTRFIESIKEDFAFKHWGIRYTIPIGAVREIYLKNSNKVINSSWLEHLQIHETPLLKDTADKINIPFKNCIVTISKDGRSAQNWSKSLPFCVWEDQIIDHDFNFFYDFSDSHFYKFLRNVTNNDDKRLITMKTGIGYLLHHHFSESEGQAVILYDENVTDIDTPMGGSGKGLIVNAIKQVRRVSKIDGKSLEPTNRFRWEPVTVSTQIVWIDDVKPTFDFSLLHSNLTDGWTVERKFLSQFLIPAEDSPKTVICSNSILKGGGTTNKRRQFAIELNDYYSKQLINGDEKPIEDTHGCIFFGKSWSLEDWNSFFMVMLDCAQEYLKNGLVHFKGINIELNRFRQITDSDFASWVNGQEFELGNKYQTKGYYQSFVFLHYGSDTRQFTQRKFTSYLKYFADWKGWKFKLSPSNGVAHFMFQKSS